LERFDLFTSSPYGRARTFVNTGMALNGNRSLTLDAAQFRGGINTNYLLGTFNFSQIPLSKGLRFEFLYKNQGQLKLPNGTLWLRGDDQSPWINAYPILNDQDALASVRKGWINIYDLLSKNQQNLSSSFQILFEQTGYTSANNASYEVYNFNQDDGITLDDLKFTDAKGDIHLVSVISPDSALCAQPNSGSIVSVRIRNYDNAIISNIPVTYRVGNLTPVTEIIPSIPANQELVYSFKTPVSNLPFGNHLMDVWVASAQDNFRSNDSILQYKVYASPVIATFPYRETFESDNGGWFTSSKYSSWTWGTLSSFSAKTFIRGAANGKKGWVTNLLEYYYPNEQSYLYSPCFNIAGLKSPVLSFSHIVAQEYARDFHTIEYSVNNGSSWIRLGLKDKGTNWFDSSALLWNNSIVRWHVSSSDLPVGATSIRFRFLFSSNGSNQFDGIGIDDVHIFDKETIYTGNNTSATQNVSGNNWTHFYSQGSIIASLHPMGQNLGNVNVKVFINQDSVRQINNQYYLDRNIVVDAASAPTDSVRIRIYYTENEVVKMINTTKCSNCIKLEDAYQTAVTQYSGFSQFENGILNDGNDGVYTFIPAENVDIVPFNNGYYAEFKVKSFSEFWLHRSDFKLIQNTTSIAENTIQESFIRSVQLLDNGSLSVVTANHPSIHEMKLRLFNGGGQEVWSSQKAYRQFEEWIPNLSPGIYFLTITDKSGKFTYQTKLIRSR
ncbi:MAG: T9SS type A sorting domain-containing protein, partial [Bacteroidetes bacterium]|nr:T9SS type A sorting domain-containing protein [Bacteroidota bacterium]